MMRHVADACEAGQAYIRRRLGDADRVLIEPKQPIAVAMHDFDGNSEVAIPWRHFA